MKCFTLNVQNMHVTPGMQPGHFPKVANGFLKKDTAGGREIWTDSVWGATPQLTEVSFSVNNDGALLELMEVVDGGKKEKGVLLLLRAPLGVVFSPVQMHQMSGTTCLYTQPGCKASRKAKTAEGYQDTEYGRADKAEIISVTSQDQEGFEIAGTPGVRRLMSWEEGGEQFALYHLKCYSGHHMWQLRRDGQGVWAQSVGRNLPLRIQRKVDGQLTSPVYFYLSEDDQIIIGRPPAKEPGKTRVQANGNGQAVASVMSNPVPGLEDLLTPPIFGGGGSPELDGLIQPVAS